MNEEKTNLLQSNGRQTTFNVALSQSPRHQQHSSKKKSVLTLHNIIYICGIYILYSKIRSRCTPPKTFELDDFPTPPSDTADNNNESYRIPKIIHQSYKSEATLPLEWADTPARWKELHPTYKYMFWSDDDNRKLIEQYYPWFLDTYDSYPAPIQRADAARYFAVLHYGGIYADMDILPIRNVDPLLYKFNLHENTDKQMLVAETYNLESPLLFYLINSCDQCEGLTNALFASIPNSTVLHDFVKELPLHTKPLHGFELFIPHFAVLLSTGPTRLWIYLNKHRETILTLNPAGWGQCHQCKQKQCVPQEGSFFETRKGGSWHKWDTRIMNFIFCHVHFCIWSGLCGLLWLYYKFIAKKNGKMANICNDLEEQREMNDVTGKKRKWNTNSRSLENVTLLLRILLSQYRFPLFCGVILILVL